MQEIGTMQVSGPMSSNSSDPKGSIFNPYTVDEFEYMFDHGLWTVGAYVQTMGYVMPTLYVQGNNNSNPPCGYVNWCYYSTMDLYGYISTFTNYCTNFLYYGSNGKFYWKNPINGTRFYGNQYVTIKKLSEMSEYATNMLLPRNRPRRWCGINTSCANSSSACRSRSCWWGFTFNFWSRCGERYRVCRP